MSTQPSILVVDDELLVRDLLYDFFSDQGWQISVTDSASKALGILQNKKVDLVLTDLKMPEMDGMDLTHKVKEEYPDMPVMVMTGYPSVESAIEALRAKVADYITKPFNINELLKAVSSHIERSDRDSRDETSS
jgi:two-component system response regulator HydG